MPAAFLPSDAVGVMKAAGRFKKAGAARRAKEAAEREEKAAQLKKELDAKGGVGTLLVSSLLQLDREHRKVADRTLRVVRWRLRRRDSRSAI